MMPTPTNPSENQSTYFINPEEAAETIRLIDLDRLFTREMGSLFPTGLDLSRVQLVLDLACGPGGWAVDVARTYPNMDVVGADLSQKMVRYAQAHARAHKLDNVSFQVMDVLEPLAFPDEAFDFVNARLISGFMPKEAWPSLLQECVRITRPGGSIRLTDGEWGFSTGEASEELTALGLRAMWVTGKTFAPQGKMSGITLMLGQFLRDAGLSHIHQQAYALDYSSGTELNEAWYQNLMIAYPLMLPFLLKTGVTTKEEFERLYEQMSLEMQAPEFRGTIFMLSVWGTRP
jgi:ubiquinone/menaquinone biosynthesis C-methylase UbiE